MAVIRKSDMQKMTDKEAETKLTELERALLELEGEGKKEKKKPVKKAIAKLKTLLSQRKGLNKGPALKDITKKKGE